MTVRDAALQAVGHISNTCLAEKRRHLTEWETYFVLRHWQVPVAPAHLVPGPAQAIEAARQLGGPVAIKIVSPDILHKTDAGCVRINVSGSPQVEGAATEVLANARLYAPTARIDGLLIQQMAPPGVELIVGGKRDNSFGPILMVGMGGIFTEIYKDVSFRLAPVTMEQAELMLRELKGHGILRGARGRQPVAMGALIQTLVNLSRLIAAWVQLQELDLNPLIVTDEGVVAVDGLAVLQQTPTL